MVVRKLRQDVAAWRAMLAKGNTDTGVPTDQLGRKLIGRSLDGKPLVPSAGSGLNDFDYDDDPQGRQCPLHAHVRRANPRSRDSLEVPSPAGGRAPRLLRRGMSYGPSWDDGKPTDERGLVFMAYNADISEQFEAIQRWLTGGNSTNGYSGQSDPMLGVPEAGKPRVFAFEDDAGQAQRVLLDGSGVSLGDEQPLVRLEWGMYLFTPSIAAVDKLRATARRNAMVGEVLWSAARGERELTQLLTQTLALPAADAAQAWKAALEDPDAQDLYRSASIWAAIRQRHGGVLRTPYGVLVAEAGAARRVLSDECHFSVGGYRERMRKSMGDIFLGMDTSGTDPVLAAKVLAINQAIKAITRDKAFVLARQATQAAIIRFVVPEVGAAALQGRPGWELDVNIRELLDDVLATVCEAWFGLANNLGTLARGGARWDWLGHQPPLYPGHFTAPSRYIFQPLPGATVESYGQSYGAALSEAVTRMVKAHRAAGTRPSQLLTAGKAKACLTEAIYDQFDDPALPDRDATIARTLVGTVMGFVPTVDGSIRRVLNEWLRDGNFWALRERVLALGSGASREQLEAILLAPMSQTMQLRPSPELVWRTAIAPTQLGPVRIEAGDQVVVGLVSVTQQSLENGVVDVMPIFGGQRWPADGSAVGAAGSPGAPAAAAACPYAAATASAAGCPVTGAGAAASAALPPHACPGQQAAMGLLLGFIGGLSEFALLPKALTKLPADLPASIRPSPVPLALHLEGALRPASAGAAETVSASTPNALAAQARDLARPTPPTGPWLLADGDSWFDYWNVPGVEPNDPNLKPCVLTLLRDTHGYQIEELADAGDLLSATASPQQLAQFSALLKRMVATGRAPKALLLSGGGNDVVAERLLPIVLTKDKAPAKGSLLSPTDLTQTIDVGLANTLRTILRHWLAARNALLPVGQRPPILLHGYDYPIPDGRNAFGVVDFEVSSWLGAVFHQCGYSDVEDRKRIDAATHELIDRLNAMQQAVAQEFNAAMKPMDVIHIDLRNTLRGSAAPPYRFDGYKTQWDNELHPTRAGFAKIAEKFAAVIASLP